MTIIERQKDQRQIKSETSENFGYRPIVTGARVTEIENTKWPERKREEAWHNPGARKGYQIEEQEDT